MDRNKIDSAIAVNGASLRSKATQFKVGIGSLKRHVAGGTLRKRLSKHKHIHEVIEANTILSKMKAVKKELSFHSLTSLSDSRSRLAQITSSGVRNARSFIRSLIIL